MKRVCAGNEIMHSQRLNNQRFKPEFLEDEADFEFIKEDSSNPPHMND